MKAIVQPYTATNRNGRKFVIYVIRDIIKTYTFHEAYCEEYFGSSRVDDLKRVFMHDFTMQKELKITAKQWDKLDTSHARCNFLYGSGYDTHAKAIRHTAFMLAKAKVVLDGGEQSNQALRELWNNGDCTGLPAFQYTALALNMQDTKDRQGWHGDDWSYRRVRSIMRAFGVSPDGVFMKYKEVMNRSGEWWDDEAFLADIRDGLKYHIESNAGCLTLSKRDLNHSLDLLVETIVAARPNA